MYLVNLTLMAMRGLEDSEIVMTEDKVRSEENVSQMQLISALQYKTITLHIRSLSDIL